MIVGYTDRIIRVYGWSYHIASANASEVGTIVFENSWELPDQVLALRSYFFDNNDKTKIPEYIKIACSLLIGVKNF